MSSTDPEAVARVLRRRAAAAALWVDVTGTSMGGSIVPGSRVLVAGVEPTRSPRRGEIWAFCDVDGRLLVHRCVGRRGASYRFRGDARRRADPRVLPERLVGPVVDVEHDGRRRSPPPWWFAAFAENVRRLGRAQQRLRHRRRHPGR